MDVSGVQSHAAPSAGFEKEVQGQGQQPARALQTDEHGAAKASESKRSVGADKVSSAKLAAGQDKREQQNGCK